MGEHRHKRDANARPKLSGTLLAGPLALAATVGAVGLGILASGPSVTAAAGPASSAGSGSVAARELDGARVDDHVLDIRHLTMSRGSSRVDDLTRIQEAMTPSALRRAIGGAHTERYTTSSLNLWTTPGPKADQTGEIAAGKKVLLTGRSLFGRDEIVVAAHETRWVSAGYFSTAKPAGVGAGLSDAPCPDSSVEYRLTANAVFVYRSVCHAFPQITAYGGYDDHGEHASGKALDIMTSDPQLLTSIADYLRAHAAELHLYDVIRMQHIWTPVRSAEGWRLMPDRGSITANHYDHVHVSTY